MSPFPAWYEHLTSALNELREIREKEYQPADKRGRHVSVIITMLEQVVAYAWLWVVKE